MMTMNAEQPDAMTPRTPPRGLLQQKAGGLLAAIQELGTLVSHLEALHGASMATPFKEKLPELGEQAMAAVSDMWHGQQYLLDEVKDREGQLDTTAQQRDVLANAIKLGGRSIGRARKWVDAGMPADATPEL